jgi:hypothetical protein
MVFSRFLFSLNLHFPISACAVRLQVSTSETRSQADLDFGLSSSSGRCQTFAPQRAFVSDARTRYCFRLSCPHPLLGVAMGGRGGRSSAGADIRIQESQQPRQSHLTRMHAQTREGPGSGRRVLAQPFDGQRWLLSLCERHAIANSMAVHNRGECAIAWKSASAARVRGYCEQNDHP